MCLLEPKGEKYYFSYRIRLRRGFQLYAFISFINKDPNDDFDDDFHLFLGLTVNMIIFKYNEISMDLCAVFQLPQAVPMF
jgi:hypothetical protein